LIIGVIIGDRRCIPFAVDVGVGNDVTLTSIILFPGKYYWWCWRLM
jgi:hypothetical protein